MVDNTTKNPIAKRRTVLKMSAGAVAGLTGFTSAGSALPTGSVSGVTYDTLTHQTGRPAHGNVAIKNGAFSGYLNIAGFHIPLDQLERVEGKGTGTRFRAFLNDQRFRRDGYPLKVEITAYHDHYSGVLSRPSGKFGKLGFILDDDAKMNPEALAAAKQPDQRWVDSPYTFRVPETGIPTDSGIKRLKQILPEQASKNGGDY